MPRNTPKSMRSTEKTYLCPLGLEALASTDNWMNVGVVSHVLTRGRHVEGLVAVEGRRHHVDPDGTAPAAGILLHTRHGPPRDHYSSGHLTLRHDVAQACNLVLGDWRAAGAPNECVRDGCGRSHGRPRRSRCCCLCCRGLRSCSRPRRVARQSRGATGRATCDQCRSSPRHLG